MRVAVAFLTCLSCVAAFPAYFLAYNRGRDLSRRSSPLDCIPPFPGFPLPYRCRRHEMNQTIRSLRRRNNPEALTVLEILEDTEDGGQNIIQVVEEGVDAPFVISVPKKKTEQKKPRCPHHKVYASELDICMDVEQPAPIVAQAPLVKEKKKTEEAVKPFVITDVGSYDKKKCAKDEIWIAELDICGPRDPPAPLAPEWSTYVE